MQHDARNETLIAEIRAALAASDPVSTLSAKLDSARTEVTGLSQEARALLLTSLQEKLRRKLLVVVPGDADIAELAGPLRLFAADEHCIATYPTPSLSPYQDVAPSLAITRDEIRSLSMLVRGAAEIVVVPARALFRRLPDPASLAARTLELSTGDEIDPREMLEQMVENGYVRTDLVGEMGEFAFRGGILDVFPPNLDSPVRLELFGDTIESIRTFDVDSQRSAQSLDRLTALPLSHFPLTPRTRDTLARKLSIDFNDPHFKRDLSEKIERLNEYGTFPGVENWLPLVNESTSFEEYLRDGSEWLVSVVEPGEIASSIAKYEALLQSEYEAATEKGRGAYPPDRVLVGGDLIHDFLGRARLGFSRLHVASGEFEERRIAAPERSSFVNRLSELPASFEDDRASGRHPVVFISTRGGKEKVERLFKELGVPFVDDAERLGEDVVVSRGNLPRGFDLESAGLALYSEWDLFEPPTSTRVGAKKRGSADAFLTDMRDLKVGDYIVHVDHGIGRFRGLQRIPFGVTEREVMELEYSSNGKLLLPVEHLNLVQKYSGGGDTEPRLDRLGGTSWARTKASVKRAMRDMADELLKLYATRRMITGTAFSSDTPWQFDFEEAFEFDETEDQVTAIDEIKRDMESRRPMDRLLCGDVGYGKTEVAMRAAFKAVMDGKQVAVLAPTTVLAYQHYRTFLRRFSSFPVTIELLTRIRSPKESKEIAAKIGTGEIDILIGTHRLLSRGAEFKDLGLLIIDEEQRFGVRHKEKLKQYKKSIDVLSMSATPIPRTLHMSLAGIRDISVIETPPKDRLAIQTAVVPFNDELIAEALEFELGRGGQVFFVHNRIDSIYTMKEHLEKLLPGLRVVIGHGQMEEKQLEKSMMAFIAREYDVLLATTIIENGIDIPACNTILINHAERFGLSQLYQLRGRVGRSDRLAFCYLVVPSERALTSDARKRLAAIQEFSDLGAGFRIAARDLEIRGAGNLLGGEQSGQIAAVGIEMYTRLLEETVRELKGEPIEEEIDTSLNLGLDIYIPDEYIGDENIRMTFYKKIASARDVSRLEDIRNEMVDRFGPLPPSIEGLFEFVRLRTLARTMGVVSVTRDRAKVAVKFRQNARIDPNRLLDLLSRDPVARFSPAGVLTLELRTSGREIVGELRDLLQSVAAAA
ncbi:MAG: transcription-repair coupling factor [Thermoanaerobaculia bacterium]